MQASQVVVLILILMVSRFVKSSGFWKSVEQVLHGGNDLLYCSLYIHFYPYLKAPM